MKKRIKVLFLGDITGRPGRVVVKDFLQEKAKDYDFVIANVENASHGFGLTFKNYNELKDMGIHCFTSGNHIWDKKEIFEYIKNADILIRPLNYPKNTLGVGYRIFEIEGFKIAVVNLLGRTFMNPLNCPFETLTEVINDIKKTTPFIIIDFHAEATAEKVCFARFCMEKNVSALIGTHTHIQTADEKIIDDRFAYITDAGFCGDFNGVIGMDYTTSLKRFTTQLPERYEVADSKIYQVNAISLVFDSYGKPKSIERINWIKDYKEKQCEG